MKLLAGLFLICATAFGESPSSSASALLASLTTAQAKEAKFPLGSEKRFDWDWTPGGRDGVVLKALTPAQRKLVMTLVESVLSEEGKRHTKEIIARETLLAKVENTSSRDPELYYLAIFGNPGPQNAWAFRFEGHHLSLNFAMKGDRIVSATPLFLGSNPATYEGVPRLLGEEIDLSLKLATSLSREQRMKALSAQFPMGSRWGNFTFPANRNYELKGTTGACEWTEEQRALLESLVKRWVTNVAGAFASPYLGKLKRDPLCLTWTGSTEGKGSYHYRVQGNDFVLEVNAVQDKGNHLHTVWRDAGDFVTLP